MSDATTIYAENVSGAEIHIDGYGAMAAGLCDELPDNSAIAEAIELGAIARRTKPDQPKTPGSPDAGATPTTATEPDASDGTAPIAADPDAGDETASIAVDPDAGDDPASAEAKTKTTHKTGRRRSETQEA